MPRCLPRRWRWVAGVALALPRFRGGKKVAPQLARMEAEDLVTAVFPDQLACAENVAGDREIPDHPLTNQAIADCLHEAMDIEGLERLLARLEAGEIRVVTRDLTQPSPLALEVLSARPYAYLDDAPLEERRTQAVMARRWLAPENASELGRLDAEAIARVRAEAWPDPVNAEELHDSLLWLGCLSCRGSADHTRVGRLADRSGARRSRDPASNASGDAVGCGRTLAAVPGSCGPRRISAPSVPPPADQALRNWSSDEALTEILRGRLEGLGPVTPGALAAPLGLEPDEISAALLALEAEGFVLRGRFSSGINVDEWCDRRLLARIHHYTVRRLRAEIEPVAARDFLRFLFDWQRVTDDARLAGPDAVQAAVGITRGLRSAGCCVGDGNPAGPYCCL